MNWTERTRPNRLPTDRKLTNHSAVLTVMFVGAGLIAVIMVLLAWLQNKILKVIT